jgi:hypothetical protein
MDKGVCYTCQTVIGANLGMTFCQILDRVLTDRPSSSLDKLEGFFVIKSKPYLSKNKEVKQHG